MLILPCRVLLLIYSICRWCWSDAFKSHTLFASTSSSSSPTRTSQSSFARIRSTQIYEHSTYSSSVSKEDCNDNDDGISSRRGSGLELWIDLRSMSITPQQSLELWQLEGGDDDNNESLSTPFAKFLVPQSSTETPRNYPNNLDVLLVADSNDIMATICQQINPHECIGRVISVEMSSSSIPILPDPIPLLEVASKGQWVIIDTNGWKKIDEDERLSMVFPLMELISSGFSADNTSGGIGLTCRTKNEVVKAAMFIQSKLNDGILPSGKGKTKTLDSGIVIPDDDNDDDSSGMSSISVKIPQKYAIIVPFDIEILRTCNILFEGIG